MKKIAFAALFSVLAVSGCKATDTIMGAVSGAAPEVPEINIQGLDAMSCQEISDTYKEYEERVAGLERAAATAGRFGAGDTASAAATQAREAYNSAIPAGQNVLRAKRCSQTL